MTGKELIQWIEEHNAQDLILRCNIEMVAAIITAPMKCYI